MKQQIWTIGGYYGTPLMKTNKKITAEEVLSLLEKGGKITINNPVEITAVVNNTSSIKIEGGSIVGSTFTESKGQMLEGDSDSYAIWVKDGGNLTIEGNGEIIAQEATYSMAVWANGGDVIIKGGTYRNGGDGTDLIYASNGGNVYIYDGEFIGAGNTGVEPGTKNKFSLLNVKDKDYKSGISNIIVYGGIFHGFNPANNLSEGPNTNFVAEGYESIEIEKDVWKVVKK